MVSDMLGSAHSMIRSRVAEGKMDLRDFISEPHKKGAHLAFLELAPESLWELKRGFEKMRQLKIDHWREVRAKRADADRSKS